MPDGRSAENEVLTKRVESVRFAAAYAAEPSEFPSPPLSMVRDAALAAAEAVKASVPELEQWIAAADSFALASTAAEVARKAGVTGRPLESLVKAENEAAAALGAVDNRVGSGGERKHLYKVAEEYARLLEVAREVLPAPEPTADQ